VAVVLATIVTSVLELPLIDSHAQAPYHPAVADLNFHASCAGKYGSNLIPTTGLGLGSNSGIVTSSALWQGPSCTSGA
jgi:hypothetical protein